MTATATAVKSSAAPAALPAAPRPAGKLTVEQAAARLAALRERIRDTEEDLARGAGGPGGPGERDLQDAAVTPPRAGWKSGPRPPSTATSPPPACSGRGWPRPRPPGARVRAGRKLIAWVGDWCWIHPRSVDGTPENWLWLKTARQADRVWAIERCCQNEAVSVVVADGRGLPMAATRRLQLAARAGGVRVLLARTPDELSMPSAAPVRGIVDGWTDFGASRTGVQADPLAASAVAEGRAGYLYATPGGASPRRAASPPRWTARLLRRKGLRPTDGSAESAAPDLLLSGGGDDGWVVEKRDAQLVVRSPDRLAGRSVPAQAKRRRLILPDRPRSRPLRLSLARCCCSPSATAGRRSSAPARWPAGPASSPA